jgi:hypothetical protein
MDITKIKRVRKVEVQIGEESFWVEHNPWKWDKQFSEEHNRLLEEEDENQDRAERGRERYIFTLAGVLEDWDITQNGEKAPICEQVLRDLADFALFEIYFAVRQDLLDLDSKKKN